MTLKRKPEVTDSINYCKENRQCHFKPSQLTFTISKSTIETLEKGVIYVQS